MQHAPHLVPITGHNTLVILSPVTWADTHLIQSPVTWSARAHHFSAIVYHPLRQARHPLYPVYAIRSGERICQWHAYTMYTSSADTTNPRASTAHARLLIMRDIRARASSAHAHTQPAHLRHPCMRIICTLTSSAHARLLHTPIIRACMSSVHANTRHLPCFFFTRACLSFAHASIPRTCVIRACASSAHVHHLRMRIIRARGSSAHVRHPRMRIICTCASSAHAFMRQPPAPVFSFCARVGEVPRANNGNEPQGVLRAGTGFTRAFQQ